MSDEIDLMDAIGLYDEPGDGQTTQELIDASGRSKSFIRASLRELHRAGKLVVGKKKSTSVDGRMQWTPTYRLKRDGE